MARKRARTRNSAKRHPSTAALGALTSWRLQDAKAQFSKVVRDARDKGPQRVTVHGKDAVVVVAAADYARLAPAAAQPSLHALLSQSPLRDLDFGRPGVRARVRGIRL
jgi:prevent-host-death family protein